MLPHTPTVLVLLGIGAFLSSMLGGLQATTVQLLAPATMRGRAMALYLLVVTVLGMGLGPLVIGLLSDHVFASLSASLATVSTAALAAASAILLAGRNAVRDALLTTNNIDR
jgi:MFS family permease